MYFNQQGFEKLNDTSTKMYFNQKGLEKLNDTPTKMYFIKQGLEKLMIHQPSGISTNRVWKT